MWEGVWCGLGSWMRVSGVMGVAVVVWEGVGCDVSSGVWCDVYM